MTGLVMDLRSAAAGAELARKRKDAQNWEANIERARVISAEMIERLPAFLKGISARGGCTAYLVGLNQYRPDSCHWPTPPWPEHPNWTVYACRKYLFGVPRHIGVWAVRQGLQLDIGYGTTCLASEIFGYSERYEEYAGWHAHRGLRVHW
jgi:hypothetical protein